MLKQLFVILVFYNSAEQHFGKYFNDFNFIFEITLTLRLDHNRLQNRGAYFFSIEYNNLRQGQFKFKQVGRKHPREELKG